MRVLALTKYDARGASSRVRLLQYLPYFERNGIDVSVRPLLPNEYLRRRYSGEKVDAAALLRYYGRRIRDAMQASNYDLVWVEYEILPWLPASFERLLLRRCAYIVDYDDAIFHNYDQHASRIVRTILGKKIDVVMRNAAAVVAGNRYLGERAASSGARNIEIIPSVVDLARFTHPDCVPEGPFTVGWIGSPGSERLLDHIAPVLAELIARRRVKVVLVGASPRALNDVPHESWPWHVDTEGAAIQRFNVGIMPLAGSPWDKGKCGYKLIQYMAAAKPVIASPVGVNTEIVDHGKTGFLASSPDEWSAAIETLCSDPALCLQLGKAGRRRAAERYNVVVTAPRLIALIRSLG